MITVFLATYNRLDTLLRTVNSFRRFTTPYELVIVDNGTHHPKAVSLLERIAKRPDVRKVYTLPRVRDMQGLTDHFNVAIKDQNRMLRKGGHHWFAVTDADICWDRTHPGALHQYVRLAKATGHSVGPHTRVEVFPKGYPLRSRVLATESRLLYKSTMKWHEGVPYSAWDIDTTFHVFPRERPFRRLKMNTVRVGPPYDAMHLDWYIDVRKPTEENWIYLAERRPPGVGSWGSDWLWGYWTQFQTDPQAAFHGLLKSKRADGDLCNTSFMLSWAHQFGFNEKGKPDRRASELELDRAVPWNSVWWQYRSGYKKMIYSDDLSVLGW